MAKDKDDKEQKRHEAKGKGGAGGIMVNDKKGKQWVLGNQGRVHLILAAHGMAKIETIYGSIFEGILGERITTRPVEVVDPFPNRGKVKVDNLNN